MRKKFFVMGGVMLAFFVGLQAILLSHMGRFEENDRLVVAYSRQIINVSELFFLATKVQQEQAELRHGIVDDINPLIDDALRMERLLVAIEADLAQAEMVRSCVACHAQYGNDHWRQMPDRLEVLRQELDSYERQVSEFVTASTPAARDAAEVQSLTSARTLVEKSSRLDSLFGLIIKHIIEWNHENGQIVARETLIVAAVGAVVVALLFVVLARRITRPILRLEKATRAISAGEFPDRIDVRTGDELELLARAFDRMVESLRSVTAERGICWPKPRSSTLCSRTRSMGRAAS